MATCPACGRRLHLWNWKQFCPSCKVNLVYYKANERLLDESEKAEIEHAAFQPKVDRAKAAFFGSPLAIVRIVLTFLPLGAIFLPLAVLNADTDITVNAISIYKFISELGGSDYLTGALPAPFTGYNKLFLALILIAVCVLFFAVNLLSLFAGLGKHHFIRHLIFNGIQTACAVGATVLVSTVTATDIEGLSKMITQNLTEAEGGVDLIAGAQVTSWQAISVSWGAYILIGVCAALLVWNIFLHFHGIPFTYKECLIGGLPKEEYYKLVNEGLSREEIRRKMLIALTDLQIKAEEEREEAERKEEEERSRRK